ncbi:hypothetical protein [Xenorhabdus budapestensis]|uniref:Uncharacterized protein n=1 Tax=Xenorhabdus budapestensis TaxID=290110 RepID=A0A2D0IPG3_XENBU|nr:hypothetical protein [Xenorhabdus budapestensis]PHM23746.1 hypothetical protein Xbud_03517 [Xenorhabdus budapestensis]
MSGHNMLFDPPKRGNQRLNIEQSATKRGEINYRDSSSLRSPIVEVIISVTSKNTVVLTLAGHSEKLFAHTLAEILADGYANIFGYLSNPLIFNQTANMQSGHNMRVSFSDAQTLRLSFSQSQKEKDSTANATLWDDGSFHHKISLMLFLWRIA